MTEQEVIQIAKNAPWELVSVDKSLITEKVLDNIPNCGIPILKRVLIGVDPKNIKKEKLLYFLNYDEDVYCVAPENLKNDSDVLNNLMSALDRLPVSLFDNDIGIQYMLDKLNIGTTWAVYDKSSQYLVISGDKFYVYFRGCYIPEAHDIATNCMGFSSYL